MGAKPHDRAKYEPRLSIIFRINPQYDIKPLVLSTLQNATASSVTTPSEVKGVRILPYSLSCGHREIHFPLSRLPIV